MSKRVLLTGGTGFIGRWAIPKLLELGYEVHLTCIENENYLNADNVFYHTCNLLDKNQLYETLENVKPEFLLHLAWDVTHDKFWTSENNIDWVNASILLLQLFFRFGGKRLVMAGTCAEYDWNCGLCNEDKTPIKPSTFYGACKASLATIVESYCKLNKISFAWGRIFNLYGPGENINRFVPSILSNMINELDVKCSHGKQIRDFMHVHDVSEAFVELLNSDVTGNVNIASGEPVSIKQVVQISSNLLNFDGNILYGAVPVKDKDPKCLIADTNKLSKKVNFVPKFTLEKGLLDTIQYLKK